MKIKNEIIINMKIKMIKNRADNLMNEELKIKENSVRYARIFFIKVMLIFISTFNKNNARINYNCVKIMNVIIILNFLIAKICYALIIFSFS